MKSSQKQPKNLYLFFFFFKNLHLMCRQRRDSGEHLADRNMPEVCILEPSLWCCWAPGTYDTVRPGAEGFFSSDVPRKYTPGYSLGKERGRELIQWYAGYPCLLAQIQWYHRRGGKRPSEGKSIPESQSPALDFRAERYWIQRLFIHFLRMY